MYTSAFEEPRAWAMEWDGEALATPQPPRPTTEMPAVLLPWTKLPATASRSRNGDGIFSDPQSWALAWEEAGLRDAPSWRPQFLPMAEEG